MKIFHKRHTPEIYKFSHNMLYVLLNLSPLPTLKKSIFFSINKFNLFSVFWKDYGFENSIDPRLYVSGILDEHDIDLSNAHDIKLLTIPKALGWGFNCLLYTSPSPRDGHQSRMPSSA